MNPEVILGTQSLSSPQQTFMSTPTSSNTDSFQYLAFRPVEFDPNEIKKVKHEPRVNPSKNFVRQNHRLPSSIRDEFYTPQKQNVFNASKVITDKM